MIDWPRLIAFGIGELRLSPAAFWSLTPREVDAILGAGALPPMDRAALARLAAAHPDREVT